MDLQEFVGTKEAAKIAKCHPYTIMGYCRQKPPKIKFGRIGRKYRFRRKDVEDFVMENGSARSR